MHQAEMDMTLTFLGLADWEPNMPDSLSLWAEAFYDPVKRDAQAPMLRDWLQRYAARLSVDPCRLPNGMSACVWLIHAMCCAII